MLWVNDDEDDDNNDDGGVAGAETGAPNPSSQGGCAGICRESHPTAAVYSVCQAGSTHCPGQSNVLTCKLY